MPETTPYNKQNATSLTRDEYNNSYSNKPAPEPRPNRPVQKFATKESKPTFLSRAWNDIVVPVVKSTWYDNIVPAIKDTISNSLTRMINGMIFGDTGNYSNYNNGRTNYSGYSRIQPYNGRPQQRVANMAVSNASIVNTFPVYDNFGNSTRAVAEEVLIGLDQIMDSQGYVSVLDFEDLIGHSSKSGDSDYGWRDIRNARPYMRGNEWCIRFPNVEQIN